MGSVPLHAGARMAKHQVCQDCQSSSQFDYYDGLLSSRTGKGIIIPDRLYLLSPRHTTSLRSYFLKTHICRF